MSLSQLNIGDPANPTLASPVLIPNLANTPGGRLLFLNRSGATLLVTFSDNKLRLILEPNDRRLVELATPESQAAFTYSVLATDITFLDTPRLDIELYAPGERIPAPFDAGALSPASLPVTLAPDIAGLTIVGTPSGINDTGIQTWVLPKFGLYLCHCKIYILDSNTGANGDLLHANWQLINGTAGDEAAIQVITMQADFGTLAGGASWRYLGGSAGGVGNINGPRAVNCMAVYHGNVASGPQVPGATSSIQLHVFVDPLTLPATYPNNPTLRIWAGVELIAA